MPTKRFRGKDADHVPVVPTMVTSAGVEFKRIQVFRNGDAHFPGMQVVVNTHRTPDINVLLDAISDKIGLVNGAKKLYSTNGVQIKDINKIKNNEKYVASSSHFTPLAYGGEKPSRSRSKSKKRSDGSVEKKAKRKSSKENEKNAGDEIEIPSNIEKKKKVKKVKKRTKRDVEEHVETKIMMTPGSRRHSTTSHNSGTLAVHTPSGTDDSDGDRSASPMGRSKTPAPHSEQPSRKPTPEHDESTTPPPPPAKESPKKGMRKKSVSRRKSQPNWGDLSNFTKNIENLLKK
ncbi:unnamed protein product [Caenorhabditis bovis]|uniref:Doublecortin domain-containing protein n=1 Tax=Caenorhabditis bovis TaxID=2654633 RepID=A0A8S1EW50_9PELO|nr:unnamed protein product [Caenorhabditis bovis]